MRRERSRLLTAIAATCALVLGLPAQHTPAARAHTTRSGADQNGAAAAATHAPEPTMPPLLALRFVQEGNVRYVARRLAPAAFAGAANDAEHGHGHEEQPQHKRPPRPSGAGRYVCAVLCCADFDVELAPLLGLRRRDVLVLRAPGPILDAEAAALLTRAVQKHHLSLVLVLGHDGCDSLEPDAEAAGGPPDAIERRVAVVRALARRRGAPLVDTMVRHQREALLASSPLLQQRRDDDDLRVVPGVVDARSHAIRWLARPAHLLPVAPVK